MCNFHETTNSEHRFFECRALATSFVIVIAKPPPWNSVEIEVHISLIWRNIPINWCNISAANKQTCVSAAALKEFHKRLENGNFRVFFCEFRVCAWFINVRWFIFRLGLRAINNNRYRTTWNLGIILWSSCKSSNINVNGWRCPTTTTTKSTNSCVMLFLDSEIP